MIYSTEHIQLKPGIESDKPRYLITSADERTWVFNQPVIFIAECCLRYDRRHIWSGMDYIIAKPYLPDQNKKDKDHLYIRDIESYLLSAICNELNNFHEINFSKRTWNILLGHWLGRYIEVVFHHYNVLKQCLEENSIIGTAIFFNENYQMATSDSDSFVWACDNDIWNNFLYSRIIKFVSDIKVDNVLNTNETGFRKENSQRKTFKRSIKKFVRDFFNSITNFFVNDNDAFIINSYLPKKEEFKLQISLGQIPKFWDSPSIIQSGQPDVKMRKMLAKSLIDNSKDVFLNCINELLFDLLPICYLENFRVLYKQACQLPWPKRPRFIFTSNSFDTDEWFKFWTAAKVEEGIAYYVGQHGNNYGTHRYINPSVEEITSDKFLTWGWMDGLSQHTPAFIFRNAGQKKQTYNSTGGLLLIEVIESMTEYNNYFEEQKILINNINEKSKENLTIRLHSAYRLFKWSVAERWHDFDPGLRIDTGENPISGLLRENRLVVYSYDSTGILETLSQNIPMLAFWQHGFNHIRESAKPYYELLADAGIIHFTPESVAQKINIVWDDVLNWWESDNVQSAREKFCSRYARISNKPVRELKKIFCS